MPIIQEVKGVPEMEISLLEWKFLTYFQKLTGSLKSKSLTYFDLFSKNKIGTIGIMYTPNYFVILGI